MPHGIVRVGYFRSVEGKCLDALDLQPRSIQNHLWISAHDAWLLPIKPKPKCAMTTDPDSMPDSKPDSKSEPKPDPKSQGKSPTATSKTPILNPTWVEEIVKSREVVGALAKVIAADLQKEAGRLLSKSLTDEWINKTIRKSFTSHLGKSRIKLG
jgi:hypothetical protein